LKKTKKHNKFIKIIILLIEISLLAGMGFFLFKVFGIGKTQEINQPNIITLDRESLSIAPEIQDDPILKGYWNIALLGVDAKTHEQLFKGSRSDSIMIASINLDTGDVRLVSVYRDTLLNIGDDTYQKCNNAYSYGGAEQTISMLNANLDLDIEDFVAVGYGALSKAIDGLGGVWVDVDSAELKHINNYQISISEVLDTDYTKVKKTGYQLLNGLQATAYCRIRHTTGNDFMRTMRQREVLKSMEEQVKEADLSTLLDTFEAVVGDVYTSLGHEEVITLLSQIANYSIDKDEGFPREDLRTTANAGKLGSVVIPLDLEENVLWLHEFLFEDPTYEVSRQVHEFSVKIEDKVDPYIK
jgi:LCP family protein required for cell wall assembly